jgi:hypothetical protein
MKMPGSRLGSAYRRRKRKGISKRAVTTIPPKMSGNRITRTFTITENIATSVADVTFTE